MNQKLYLLIIGLVMAAFLLTLGEFTGKELLINSGGLTLVLSALYFPVATVSEIYDYYSTGEEKTKEDSIEVD